MDDRVEQAAGSRQKAEGRGRTKASHKSYRTATTVMVNGRLPDDYEMMVKLNAAADKSNLSVGATAKVLLEYAIEHCSKLDASDIALARARIEQALR